MNNRKYFWILKKKKKNIPSVHCRKEPRFQIDSLVWTVTRCKRRLQVISSPRSWTEQLSKINFFTKFNTDFSTHYNRASRTHLNKNSSLSLSRKSAGTLPTNTKSRLLVYVSAPSCYTSVCPPVRGSALTWQPCSSDAVYFAQDILCPCQILDKSCGRVSAVIYIYNRLYRV